MPSENEINECIAKLKTDADAGGYNLNPNIEDLKMIITGYLENEKRFGYPVCPCRLPSGNYEEDKDIICPCDYRDDDIVEYGQCYCSLYVDDEIALGNKNTEPIPERRGTVKMEKNVQQTDIKQENEVQVFSSVIKINIWRCPVCGYLCAKDQPPPKCPICGVKRDRFELFIKAG